MNKRFLAAMTALLAAATWALQAQNQTVSDTLGVVTAGSGNVSELLRGRLSGVRVSAIDGNPVGGENIHIRGVNSLRTDNQPLWIVDGVILSTDLRENLDAFWQYGEQSYTAPLNPLAFLNAYEIERIEVLKDAAATALYGTRGAAGVIIVETRRPKTGENNFFWNSDFGYGGGFNQMHRVGFNGTANNTSYHLSLAYRGLNGSLPDNGSGYTSFKGNFETRASKFVWFGFNALLSGGKVSSPTGVTYLGLPSLTLARRDPALSPGTSEADWKADYDDDTEDYRSLVSSYIRFNLSTFLYLRFNVGMDLQSNYRTLWYGRRTYFGAPSSTNINGGAAANLVSFLASYNISGEAHFNKYFAVHHHLRLKAGVEFLGNNNKFNTLNGINFVSEELRGNGLRIGAYDINPHKFFRKYKHLGAYADLAYTFKDFLRLDGVFRTDYTPKYKGEGFTTFPAVTATLDLHRILMPAGRKVSSLTLQGGYGISGYEKYVPYELFGDYLSGSWYKPADGTSTFYDGLDRLRTRELTLALRASFADGRFGFKAGYYDRITDDDFLMYQMGHAPDSNPSGAWEWDGCSKVFARESAIRNRGLEFDVNAQILNAGAVRWTVEGNFTRNVNRVVSSNTEDFLGRVVGHGIYCTCNALDLPVSSLYGYKAGADGQYVDITGEGRIDEADKVILGNTVPKFFGGLSSTLDYGRLSFTLVLEAAGGHNVADVNSLVSDGVVGPDGLICLSSRYVKKADYLRLTHLGLKYRVNARIWKFRECAVTASAHNLLTVTGYDGYNPDVNCFGASTLTNGLDYGSFPLSPLFILGFSARF